MMHVISVFDLTVLGMPHAGFLVPSIVWDPDFVATHLSHADGSRSLGIAGQPRRENLVFWMIMEGKVIHCSLLPQTC